MKLRRSFFNLYHAISTMEYRTNNLNSGDFSYRDIMYLNLIMFMDECTVTKLASLLSITKPAVTVKINQLIDKGLVIKVKSRTDERINILMASPMVYTLFSNEDRSINRAINKLTETYTGEEVEKFSIMLNNLSNYLVEEVALDSPAPSAMSTPKIVKGI